MGMSLTNFFGLLGGLLVLAFVANRLARRTRVPDVIVLMATGVLLGPVLHWVDASRFEQVTHGFGTLALILILFEAGLELDIRDTLRHFPGGLVLAVLSYTLSLGAVALLCAYSMRLPRISAVLVGAVMGCMSSSVLLPVLQQIELRIPVKVTLMVEASFGDALGALTVGVLLDLAAGQNSLPGGSLAALLTEMGLSPATRGGVIGGVAGIFVLKIAISLILATLAGILWSRLLPVLSEERFWHVLTFAAVLLLYAGTHAAEGSELFAVMAFGVVLSNFPGKNRPLIESAFALETPSKAHHRQILTFHSELGFLVRTFFFVLIGATTQFIGLRRHLIESLGILGALFLARVLAVQTSRVAWRGIESKERELACLIIPRGLITAVLALEVVQARGSEFQFLIPLAFGVILLTNLLLLVGTVRADSVTAVGHPESDAALRLAASAAPGGSGAPPIQPEGD